MPSEVLIAAAAAALCSIITAIATAATTLRLARHRDRIEDREAVVEQYQAIVDRQGEKIDRLEAALDELRDEHTTCQVRTAELRQCLLTMHAQAKRLADACRKAGIDPGPELPLPLVEDEE